jgi:hypothetical protein
MTPAARRGESAAPRRIAGFVALSAAGTPPIVWVSVVALLVLAMTAASGSPSPRAGARRHGRGGLADPGGTRPDLVAVLVFTHSFRDTRTADMAFASNLLGAMVGGTLEYLALITGYGALLIVVAALYAAAWLFATRLRILSDAELSGAR